VEQLQRWVVRSELLYELADRWTIGGSFRELWQREEWTQQLNDELSYDGGASLGLQLKP
jgi:hypothetical protein